MKFFGFPLLFVSHTHEIRIKTCFTYFYQSKGKKKPGPLSDKYVFSTLEKMTNDIDQVKSEVGNIQDKLESLMMARQEETQHQG